MLNLDISNKLKKYTCVLVTIEGRQQEIPKSKKNSGILENCEGSEIKCQKCPTFVTKELLDLVKGKLSVKTADIHGFIGH